MRARAAGLVLLAIVREAAANGCAILPPAGSQVDTRWLPQGAVHQAISAGALEANIILPPTGQGFNRTVSLEGICDNSVTTSSLFECQSAAGEFHAGLTAQSPVKLSFGQATCHLTGVGAYKTDKASGFEAELRLQFDGCTGSPSGITTAAVVVGIRKDPVNDVNLLAWSKQVCKTVTTTTAPSAQVSQETDAFTQEVGSGKCQAAERRRIEDVASEDACKLQCIGSATSAQILGGVGCRGFSFKAGASGPTCITYSGDVTQATSDEGWKCFNMSYKQTMIAKSTPAPPAVVKEIPEELYVQEALGQSGVAYMQEILPPTDAPTCFKPMWWFRLEDREGNPLSVAVKEANWDELMNNLPTGQTTSVVSAPMVLDRVLFDTCTKSDGWSAKTCFVPPPPETQCRSSEVSSALVSGVITSLLTWVLVGFAFMFWSKARGRPKNQDYTALETTNPLTQNLCDRTTICLLSSVAIGGACFSTWVSTKFLEAVMRSQGCYDFDEFLVVILAVMLSVAVTIVIILMYMTKFPAHDHPVFKPTSKQEVQQSHMMLVEVEDGQSHGHHISSITAQQGPQGSTMMRTNNSPFGTTSPMQSQNQNFMSGPMMSGGSQPSMPGGAPGGSTMGR